MLNMNSYIKEYADMKNCFKIIEGVKIKCSSESGRKQLAEKYAKKYNIELTYD